MMMFSNFGSPFGDDGLDAIIDGIKNLEVNFTVVYVWRFSQLSMTVCSAVFA